MMLRKLIFLLLLLTDFIKAEPIQLTNLTFSGKEHIRWLICMNDELTLKPLENKTDFCYEWYEKPVGASNYVFLNNTYEIVINPLITTYYRVDKKECDGNNILFSWYFKVYVVTSIDIHEKDNITECMEGSNISIIGSINCQHCEEVSTKMSEILLEYKTDASYNFPADELKIELGKFKTTMAKEITPERQKIADKMYLLKIKAFLGLKPVGICFSNEISINIKRLWIEKFTHHNSPVPDDWHVVINEAVDCKAFATDDCFEFKWSPLYSIWKFTNNISNNREINNLIFLPNYKNSGKMPNKNIDLGPTNGIIVLECRIKGGKKIGTISSKFLVNVGQEINQLDPDIKYSTMNENKRAKVFFKRGDEIPEDKGVGNLDKPIPLWLYYWRDQIPKSKFIKLILKDYENSAEHAYTGRPIRDALSPKEGHTFNEQTTSVKLYVGLELFVKNGNTVPPTGIHSFYCVIAHESFHADFIANRWINGYHRSLDMDSPHEIAPGDYYPDTWESQRRPVVLAKYPFLNTYDDFYSYTYANNTNPNWTLSGSIGWHYEEDSANVKAKDAEKIKYEVDKFDWSYEKDPKLSKLQGKQWNKVIQ